MTHQRHLTLFFFLVALIIGFASCNKGSKQSDQDQIEENVRAYFFLSDSIEVDVQITDTIYVDDLDKMLETVENNLSLINQDLDTLSLMIDDAAYQKLNYEKEVLNAGFFSKDKYLDSMHNAEKTFLEYQLKQALLNSKKDGFKQTNRVLLHLQRSIWANIAGFNIQVNYKFSGNPIELELLMDAQFNVVD